MAELLTLNPCHCGARKLVLSQISEQHYEVRCSRCMDFAWGNTPDYAIKKWNDAQEKEENPKMSSNQPKTVKDCCKHLINLVEAKDDRKDVRVLLCRICGCKHIRFKTDPGSIFAKEG